MTRLRVIPVLDLRDGTVVRARAGQRDAYAPIRTPLASGSAPADVAHGLLAAYPADTLYVADLDAIIDGRAVDLASLRAIRLRCPGIDLWVDAGFSEQATIEHFVDSGLGRPVLGSESQRDANLVRSFGGDAILSLDTRGSERLGPDELHAVPELWPDDVIVMTLASVGVGGGPDLRAVTAARARSGSIRLHAAGGVRDQDDLLALERAGADGALVASAIHDGRLRPPG